MYDTDTLLTALTGLVGFRDNGATGDDAAISTELQTSRSGLYIDGAHPLITADILVNALVLPVVDQNSEDSALSVELKQVVRDSATAVLTALRTRKLQRYETGHLLAETVLYDGEGAAYDVIQPAGRFNGLRLFVADSTLAIPLTGIGLQFTGAVTGFPIHVLETGQTATVSVDRANRIAWADTDIVLRGRNSYTVGYYEDDLPDGVRAIRRSKDIIVPGCQSCDVVNSRIATKWSPFITVQAVRIDNIGDEPDVMPMTNFGINLRFSIGCDLTGILRANAMQFASALQQQAVVMLLQELAYTPTISTKEQQTKQNAMFALQNGELSKLDAVLNALDIDLSGLSPLCLPDTRTNGRVKKTTVWGR